MEKWNLVVDVARCTNCQLCVLACHDEHVGNSFPGYAEEMPKHGHRWIEIKARERGTAPMIDVAYVPVMCQHCDDAPCIKAAEAAGIADAIGKRPDGIVVIDPDKAKGRRDLVESCPYGAIWWNEEKQLPQHWIFDAHLIDAGWSEPRAVTVCAPGALSALKVEDEEMRRLAAEEELEALRPDLGTAPRVWYKNMWRYTKEFIGGSLEAEADGVVDCVAGAAVALYRGEEKIAETRSDAYGDFRFDRLEPDSGEYRVSIESDGHAPKTVPVTLGRSTYLGDIRL